MVPITNPTMAKLSLALRRHLYRSVGTVAAAAALFVAALAIIPANARAATSPTSSASPSAGSATETTAASCSWNFNWYVSWPPTGGYSKVEWTSNPCGYLIQDRSYCESAIQSGSANWSYSGKVKSTYLWDQADCGISQVITTAQERIYNGSSWSSWHTYWTRPSP